MADIINTLFTVIVIAVICIIFGTLTGCAVNKIDADGYSYNHGDSNVYVNYVKTEREVNAKCGFNKRVYGCTKKYETVNTYVIHTLPVTACLEHEKEHVKKWDWHPANWIDDKCNRAARVYLADLKHKRV